MRIYTDETQGAEHIVLIKGDISAAEPVLVRMHAMDPMLDVVGTGPKGRTGEFGDAMRLIAAEGRGVLVAIRSVICSLFIQHIVHTSNITRRSSPRHAIRPARCETETDPPHASRVV